jgi:hypothetical protein
LAQETTAKPPIEISATPEKKKQINLQEIVDSLKSTADDIGQISELTSEEKILVGQFFTSLLKLMQPLASSIAVNPTALPSQIAGANKANIDPTGHLVLQFDDGRIELRNLSEEKYRDLMMVVVEDVVPKFKSLTSQQKKKLENRIKMLSSITKEIQKSSEALSAALSYSQEA